jgi:hypothetical protein
VAERKASRKKKAMPEQAVNGAWRAAVNGACGYGGHRRHKSDSVYSDGFVCASITSQSRPTLKTKATI